MSERIGLTREQGQYYRFISEVVRSYDNPVLPLGAVNHAILSAVLDRHMQGMFWESGRLADQMISDNQISGALDTSFGNVAQLWDAKNIKIEPARTGGRYANECADWWRDHHADVIDSAGLESVNRDSKLMGFSVGQIGYKNWQPRWMRWHPSMVYYNRTERNFRAYTQNNSTEAIYPDSGKWIVFSPYDHYLSWYHGGIRKLATLWLTKIYCLRDWSRYATVYGNMIKVLRIPHKSEPAREREMLEKIKHFESEDILPLPQVTTNGNGWDLELVGAPPGTADVFEKLIKYCDGSIIQYILGQDTTTHMTGGAYNAVESIWDATTLGKARRDVRSLNDRFLRPLVKNVTRLMWGTDKLAPSFQISFDEIAYKSDSAHQDANRAAAPAPAAGGQDAQAQKPPAMVQPVGAS
jgi:hypothetical protein